MKNIWLHYGYGSSNKEEMWLYKTASVMIVNVEYMMLYKMVINLGLYNK